MTKLFLNEGDDILDNLCAHCRPVSERSYEVVSLTPYTHAAVKSVGKLLLRDPQFTVYCLQYDKTKNSNTADDFCSFIDRQLIRTWIWEHQLTVI